MSSAREIQAIEAAAQRAYAAAKPTNLVASPTFTNASQKARYVPPAMNSSRTGANDANAIKSLPMGPQIERAFFCPEAV